MKPSGLPTKDLAERRNPPRSDAPNNRESGSISNESDGTHAAISAGNGGDNDRGEEGILLARDGMANLGSSDMDSIASTYLRRSHVSAEQQEQHQPRLISASEMLQESEARRLRVLLILERALEISKEATEDEDDAEQDHVGASPSD